MSGWKEALHHRRSTQQHHEEDLIQVAPPSPSPGGGGGGGGGGKADDGSTATKITLLRATTTTTTVTKTSFLAMRSTATSTSDKEANSSSGATAAAAAAAAGAAKSSRAGSGSGGESSALDVVTGARIGKSRAKGDAGARLPKIKSVLLQGMLAYLVLCLPGNFIALWVTERNPNVTEFAATYNSKGRRLALDDEHEISSSLNKFKLCGDPNRTALAASAAGQSKVKVFINAPNDDAGVDSKATVISVDQTAQPLSPTEEDEIIEGQVRSYFALVKDELCKWNNPEGISSADADATAPPAARASNVDPMMQHFFYCIQMGREAFKKELLLRKGNLTQEETRRLRARKMQQLQTIFCAPRDHNNSGGNSDQDEKVLEAKIIQCLADTVNLYTSTGSRTSKPMQMRGRRRRRRRRRQRNLQKRAWARDSETAFREAISRYPLPSAVAPADKLRRRRRDTGDDDDVNPGLKASQGKAKAAADGAGIGSSTPSAKTDSIADAEGEEEDNRGGYRCHESLIEYGNFVIISREILENFCLTAIGCIGLVGNFFTLIILSKQESASSFNKLLMSLTVVDSLLIVLYIMDSAIKSAECEPPWYASFFPIFFYPTRHIALSCSVFMVVAISAERYKAICHPLRHRPAIWQYVSIVVLISTLQNLPRFLEYKYMGGLFSMYTKPNTPLLINELFIRYRSWWDNLFTLGLFPTISLIYFNLRIYWKIRASSKYRYRFVGNSALRRRLSTLPPPPPSTATTTSSFLSEGATMMGRGSVKLHCGAAGVGGDGGAARSMLRRTASSSGAARASRTPSRLRIKLPAGRESLKVEDEVETFQCKPMLQLGCGGGVDSGCGSSVAGSVSVATSPRHPHVHLHPAGGRGILKECACRSCAAAGDRTGSFKRLQRSRRRMIKRTGSLELRGIRKMNQEVSRSTSHGQVEGVPQSFWPVPAAPDGTPSTTSRRRRKNSAPSCCGSFLRPSARESGSPEANGPPAGGAYLTSSRCYPLTACPSPTSVCRLGSLAGRDEYDFDETDKRNDVFPSTSSLNPFDNNTLNRRTVHRYASGQMLIKRKREKSTNILIAIVVVFLLCHFFRIMVFGYIGTHPGPTSPSTRAHFEYCVARNRFHIPVAMYLSLSLMNVLIVANSSVNFVIYCVVENSFREELFRMIKAIATLPCRLKRKQQNSAS